MILAFLQGLSSAGMTDAGSMVGHAMKSLPGLVKLTNTFADLAGVAILIAGIFKFTDVKGVNPQGRYRAITPILWVVVGSALLNLAGSIETGLTTIFGSGADVHNLLAYQGSNLPSASQTLIQALVAFARLFGLWAAIRGLMVLRHVGDPNYQKGNAFKSGLMRFVFGCLLLNIVQSVNVLANWIGVGHSLT